VSDEAEKTEAEKAKAKQTLENSVMGKAVAGVFLTVLAPVLVAFGIQYSDALIAQLTASAELGDGAKIHRLTAAFQDYSGAELVFESNQLPPGEYHDKMVPLSPSSLLKNLAASPFVLERLR
jgi:hypothetical protein